jgi:predicted small secreted protein
MKKLTLLSLLAVILMTSLLGCNAARGAGKDIENTGKHIENIGK